MDRPRISCNSSFSYNFGAGNPFLALFLGDFWFSLRAQLIAVTYFMSDVKVKVKVNVIS